MQLTYVQLSSRTILIQSPTNLLAVTCANWQTNLTEEGAEETSARFLQAGGPPIVNPVWGGGGEKGRHQLLQYACFNPPPLKKETLPKGTSCHQIEHLMSIS